MTDDDKVKGDSEYQDSHRCMVESWIVMMLVILGLVPSLILTLGRHRLVDEHSIWSELGGLRLTELAVAVPASRWRFEGTLDAHGTGIVPMG